jgi:hypothetical protein
MLTAENYFSIENQMKYMGASQFKDFMNCEAGALAKIKGEWEEQKTTALLVGSYVDAHYEGTLDIFKAKNPEIFLKGKPELKAEYKQAEYIINRIERDELFQSFMSGEKQVIKTGEIFGVPFKIKIDSYHPRNMIVDLKVMKDFEPIWKDGLRLNFVEAWGYDIQAAIYQFIEGNNLPFYIAAATKEKPEPDLAILNIPQNRLDYCLEVVMDNVKRFDAIKKGKIEPKRCEHCDYCKSTKVLTEVISYDSI